ncbi:MAG: LemA family protein [Candidatus Diapherotrites archaeon]|nr:LemA family protein [Candidatus Diapherotrites archaeon]
MALEWVFLGIGVLILVFLGWLVLTYNGFIQGRNRIQEAWSQIEVQMKRRFDLVPNLVETVKGYARHEKGTFEMVTKARSAMLEAKTVGESAQAENMLTGALKSLFAVAEAYPDLKANQNFLMLQEELAGIESKIAYARQFYNGEVLKFNNLVEFFPSNVIAGMFRFERKEFFDAEEIASQPVKVSFE